MTHVIFFILTGSWKNPPQNSATLVVLLVNSLLSCSQCTDICMSHSVVTQAFKHALCLINHTDSRKILPPDWLIFTCNLWSFHFALLITRVSRMMECLLLCCLLLAGLFFSDPSRILPWLSTTLGGQLRHTPWSPGLQRFLGWVCLCHPCITATLRHDCYILDNLPPFTSSHLLFYLSLWPLFPSLGYDVYFGGGCLQAHKNS